MAIIFELSAEFGSSKEMADNFARHFDGLKWTLSGGIVSSISIGDDDIFREASKSWWCRVVPSGLNKSGVFTKDAGEIAILLYQRLRTAPPFRFAFVGFEVEGFREYNELIEENDLVAISGPFNGLVISKEIWELKGCPNIFVPFSQNYYWRPYVGSGYFR